MGYHSLVLFDLDGTLADTHQLIFDSFNHVLRKYKFIEMTPKQILSYFGPPEEVCLRNMIGSESFDQVWNDFLAYYEAHLGESTVYDGLKELLVKLKTSGALIGVFTAKGTTTADLTLEYHGLKDLFDIIITGSQVKNHKPDPEGVHAAMNRLDKSPDETIVVGDSPSDFKAAAAAGADFVAVLYDNLSKDRFNSIRCRKAGSVEELSAILLERLERSGAT